tara:strand:- start:866 stop:1099 length:234 start_codon:yes stop_codon:yes gene_type:complete
MTALDLSELAAELGLEPAPSKGPILVFSAKDIAWMMDAGILYALSPADEKHHPGAVAMKNGVPVYESQMIDEQRGER